MTEGPLIWLPRVAEDAGEMIGLPGCRRTLIAGFHSADPVRVDASSTAPTKAHRSGVDNMAIMYSNLTENRREQAVSVQGGERHAVRLFWVRISWR